MTTKVFTTIIYKERDICVAQCPELCTVSQEKSVKFAIAKFKEATALT